MKYIRIIAFILLLGALTGCAAGKVAEHQVNRVKGKISNNYHAKSYSKALSRNAPRLLGTWTRTEAWPISKLTSEYTNQSISLFSDGTYASRTERFTGFFSPIELPEDLSHPASNTATAYLFQVRSPHKYGVDTSRGNIYSSKGQWLRIGPNIIALTPEDGVRSLHIDLSKWSNRSTDFIEWLDQDKVELEESPQPIDYYQSPIERWPNHENGEALYESDAPVWLSPWIRHSSEWDFTRPGLSDPSKDE